MPAQTKRLVLEQCYDWTHSEKDYPVYQYMVKRAYNTTRYPLGACLDKAQVEELIAMHFVVEIREQS